MKKIITLFAIIGLVAFSSCEGPEGPMGPPGFDTLLPEVFEVYPDFTQGNDYSVTFPLDPVMHSGDNILIYELVSTSGVKTWALLPQIYYFNNGLETAQYNYTFSFNKFTIFIDGSVSDFSSLPSNFRLGKTFRVVIIEGDNGLASKTSKIKTSVDLSDYNAVIKAYNIDDSNVKELK
jgi:hypothetical protein